MVISTKTLSPDEKARQALALAQERARQAEWDAYRALEEKHREARFGPRVAKPKVIKHGTLTGYKTHRCRCDECKRVMSEYMKDYKKRKGLYTPRKIQESHIRPDRPVKDHMHGTPTGYVYGCRCEDCRRAHRESKPKSKTRHGTERAYTKKKCRCARCVSAQRKRGKAKWQRQKARKEALKA